MGLTLTDYGPTHTGKGVPLGVSAGDEDIKTWIYRNAGVQSDSFLKLVVIVRSVHNISTLMTTYCISKNDQLGKSKHIQSVKTKGKENKKMFPLQDYLSISKCNFKAFRCKGLLASSNDSTNSPTITIA